MRFSPAPLLVMLMGLALAGAPTDRPAADTDRDGYPDVLQLVGQDRASFADWFASVAESQFYGISSDWRPEYRDCSGLARYAFVNALRKHDAAWWAKFEYIPRPRTPEVAAYRFPAPVVSASLFRVAPGPYRADDVNQGRMVGHTTAQYLLNYSTFPVGRDLRRAQRGDLLFFLRPHLGAYHTMIYLGGDRIVYHTGTSVGDAGEVRLVTLQTLMKHPDAAFHPVADNPNFVGVYRWKILK